MAAPKMPSVAVRDQPSPFVSASPSRHLTSAPSTTALRTALPDAPTSSPVASAAASTGAYGNRTPGSYTASKSRACMSVALIIAAEVAGSRSPNTSSVDCAAPPFSRAKATPASIPAALEPATATASVSTMNPCVARTVATGRSSNDVSTTASAISCATSTGGSQRAAYPAAIHLDDGAGDPARGLAREEHDHRCNVRGRAEAPERHELQVACPLLLLGNARGGCARHRVAAQPVGHHGSRQHGVDRDAVLAEVIGQVLGEARDRRADAVGERHQRDGLLDRGGLEIDDASPSLRAHVRKRVTDHSHRAHEVELERGLEIVVREVVEPPLRRTAGIGDEDVRAAAPSCSPLDERSCTFGRGHVRRYAMNL